MAYQFSNGNIVNGKRISLPSSATAADIVRASGSTAPADTRSVVRVGQQGNERLAPGQSYSIQAGDRFQVVPDRTKGAATYTGRKSDMTKAVIADQVRDLSQNMFVGSQVSLDEDFNWVVFEGFRLPKAWAAANPGHETVSMMLIFPDQYPEVPTNGFYLPSYIKKPAGENHLLSGGAHGAYGSNKEEMDELASAGWKWYCMNIKPGAWSPARIQRLDDWRKGDNLWHILTLCREVLSSPGSN